MPTWLRASSLIAPLLLAACAQRLPSAPRPLAIEPGTGPTGLAVPVTIRGTDFYLDVRVSFVDESRSRVGTAFRARLGELELDAVTFVDATTLTATVPAGLAPGTYDLTVEDPAGRTGVHAQAYTVTSAGLHLEDAPGGRGVEIGDVELRLGQTLRLFAVRRDLDGAFLEDLEASWSVEGDIGTLDRDAGTATVLTTTAAGTGAVGAAAPGWGADQTGVIRVVACTSDEECADPCRPTWACTGGVCVLGPAGADTDGDGVPDRCDPCPLDNPDDSDADGVCDSADVCPAGDDRVDTDGDGVPDACDPCPLDDPDDSDADGVCDSADVCPGYDDAVDTDHDGVPDGCDPCPGVQTPTWWDGGYALRLPLTITETASGVLPAGYSVVVTLDTAALVTAGAVRPDANDLRIVWHDGATPRELDRRVVAFDSAATTVWFKTQATVDGADATYYLYYGNPAAAAAPSHWADQLGAGATPSGVYLAADDFEADAVGSRPAGWEGSARYEVEAVGGNHVLGVTGTDGPADYLFAGDYTWTDIVLQARMSVPLTSGTYCGLWARAMSASNFDTLFYGLATNGTLSAYACSITSADATGLSSGNLLRSWNLNPDAGTTWHDYEVRLVGQSGSFWYDGAQVGTQTLSAGQLTHGRIGVCAGYPATRVLWDDFVVRKYVSPEPTVAAASAEPYCP